MNLELYLTFVAASSLLILIPGPMVSLILATSLSHGARPALITVAGSSSAILVQLAVTSLGMTSLLLVLSQWFEVLRWAGVAYLFWLGLQHWRRKPHGLEAAEAKPGSAGALFLRGFIVNGTNPKTLFFYAAFFPQFVDPVGPLVTQLVVLSATFLAVATLIDGGYAILAGQARHWLRGRWLRFRDRVTGSLLFCAGIGLALARRD